MDHHTSQELVNLLRSAKRYTVKEPFSTPLKDFHQWADSTDDERLDPYNGLPLIATIDKLFDRYLIAFTPTTGEMLFSDTITETDRTTLGIPANLWQIPNKKQAHFLQEHLDMFELNIMDSY